MYIKKALILLTALFCALLSGGCYTKLMTYQGEILAGRDSTGAGCGDCREVAPAADRREICVWERDMFGYPDLRCYNTNYSSSWVYFHNTPWWYRNSYGWYDTRGCPPYYYFDRISGICRYYGSSTYPPGNPGTGGSGGGGDLYREPPPRRNSRVVQPPPVRASAPEQSEEASAPPSSSGLPPMFSGGSSAPLSPVGSPVTSSSSSSSSSSGQTLSKPQDAPPPQKQETQASQPQTQQPQPQRDLPKRDEQPSRRSSRGF